MSEQRLTWHFQNWAYWQRDIASDYGQGFSHKDSSGAENYGSLNCDERAYDNSCAISAKAVDACLESVSPAEFAAVRHTHMEAVWRFGRRKLEQLYASARVKVNEGLVLRGIE